MAKFNRKIVAPVVVNAAKAIAFPESPPLALAGLVLTSFVDDRFYESGPAQLARLRQLVSVVDPEFSLSLALFARHAFGMRSITHALTCELLHSQRLPNRLRRELVREVVRRPDDITEIIAYWGNVYGKPFPNALKRGLADSFSRFDAYQLAKYRGEGNQVKLVDAVNLVHPTPVDKNREALSALVKGTLRETGTWETELSNPGDRTKASIWNALLSERKLGYFALLRNLRNIERDGDANAVALAQAQLTDSMAIEKSLVLPFRFYSAFKSVETLGMKRAIAQAADLALVNTPHFSGKVMVALDTSGSMTGRPIDIGAMFAAALLKRNDAMLVLFDHGSRSHTLTQPNASVIEIADEIKKHCNYGGTDFNAIFKCTGLTPFDRIFILSDMQGWVNNSHLRDTFREWKAATHCAPRVYSFNLNDYGSLMFPEPSVYAIAGWSEKVFDLISLLDTDPKAMLDSILNYRPVV